MRVAGDVVSARDIASVVSDVTGRTHHTLRVGGIGVLDAVIRVARAVAPQRSEVFPAWQGMQYMRDMFSGRARLQPLDVDRYHLVHRTSLHEHLATRA